MGFNTFNLGIIASKKTSQFSPLIDDLNLTNYWDSSVESSIVDYLRESLYLTRWDDLKGSNNLTQSTTSNQPSYIANYQNNLNAVYFSGANQHMLNSVLSVNGTKTILILSKITALSTLSQLCDGITNRQVIRYNDASTARVTDGISGLNTSQTLDTSKFHLRGAIFDNTESFFIYDNTITSLGAGFSNTDLLGFVLNGASNFSSVGGCVEYIAEVAIRTGAIPQSLLNNYYNYYVNKWGVS